VSLDSIVEICDPFDQEWVISADFNARIGQTNSPNSNYTRCSREVKTNYRGKQLMNFLKISDFSIANGCLSSDKKGDFTFHNKNAVAL
jgi:hypothetical protein